MKHQPTSTEASAFQTVSGRLHRLVRFLDPWGHTRRGVKLKELEAVMEHWHKEESESLIKAREALECNSIDRWEMWMKRSKEARLRCNKDFRKPLDELSGRSNFIT